EPMAHVFRTDDGGQTWTPRADGLPPAPANVVRFDPAAPDRLFLGTDAGAFFSADGGASWRLLGPGLPAAPVLDLDLYRPTTATHPVAELVAATFGRGMYRFDLTQLPGEPVVTAPGPAVTGAAVALTASPNPSRG